MSAETFPNSLPSALNLTRPGIIEASAGTGKTFTIAEIFLTLLLGKKTYSPNADATDFPDAAAEKTAAPNAAGTRPRPPHVREILVVTFTNAATAELKTRLRERIRRSLAETADAAPLALRLAEEEFDEASIFTIDGFCLRMLKEFGIAPTRTENVVASTNAEFDRFAERFRARKIVGGNKNFSAVSTENIRAVVIPISENPKIVPVAPNTEKRTDTDGTGTAKTDGNAAAVANALFEAARELPPLWREQRRAAHDISHNETLSALRDALAENPSLAKKLAAKFRCALVDEFQDTDPVQWEIFRRIFLANDKPIFCIGDPKQAIYSFRGGELATYRAARAEIRKKSGGNTLTLGENWRSTPQTIAALNEIFSFDKKIARELDVGTAKSPKIVALNVPADGVLEFAPVAFPQKKRAALGTAVNDAVPAAVLKIAPVTTNKDDARKNVAESVVADIAELVKRRGVPAREIAVLVLKNDTAADFRRRLEAEKIPVSTTASGSVLREAVATQLDDLMRAMLEPQSETKFRRALLSPFFAGIGEKILAADLAAETNDANAAETNDAETTLSREAAQSAFAEARTAWEKHGFFPAFRKLAETLGFFKNFANVPAADTLTANVLHLVEILHERERSGRLSPRALVAEFEKLLNADDETKNGEEFCLRSANDDENAVKIQTVHKSKGLEFGIVFLPSLWDRALAPKKSAFVKKIVPAARTDGTDAANGAGTSDEFAGTTQFLFDKNSPEFSRAALEKSLSDEACTFYVALTRAKRGLVVYHAPQGESSRSNERWNSYQKQIFEAAGALTEDFSAGVAAAKKTLPHWKICALADALPSEIFPSQNREIGAPAGTAGAHKTPSAGNAARSDAEAPSSDENALISDAEAQRRFDFADGARRRIFREAESVFSFSKLIRASETEEEFFRDDDDENSRASAKNVPAETDASAWRAGETVFPKQPFFDLPAGAEFGTVAHAIFEKTDFRTRKNLGEVVDANLALLAANGTDRGELRAKLVQMTERNLAIPLALGNGGGNGGAGTRDGELALDFGANGANGGGRNGVFRLNELDATDRASELDFYFPLKCSRTLYAELAKIFTRRGGIYAETAALHWPDGKPAGTAPNVAGMMTGFIDLAFRAHGKFFILDWKTNRVVDGRGNADGSAESLSQSALRAEIVRHGYALQWTIYAVALRKFLQTSLGERYVHDRDFGGIVYLFVRWCAPFIDTKSLSSAWLDELESVLFE